MILLGTLSLTGCISGSKLGWAGTVVDGDILYVASMEGELIAYDLADGRNYKWRITLGSVLYGRPVVSDGFIYVTTATGSLYKVNADSGASISTKVGDNSEIIGGVEVALDTVYVGVTDYNTTGGALYALNTENLSLKWNYPPDGMLEGRIWTTPTVDVTGEDSGLVYFGCFDHYIYALDATTGTPEWRYEAGGAITSKPLVYNGNVYFGSFDRRFYALDKRDGSEKWAAPFPAGNWFWAEAIAGDGVVYVGSLDKKLYALDAANGEKKGEFLTDGQINAPPVLAGDTLIVASRSDNGKVYGRDAADLAVSKWASEYTMHQAVESPMSVHGDFLYIYGKNSKLVAIRIDSGAEVWTTTTVPIT